MQSDSYGQGIPYPTLTDKPNIQTMGSGIVDGIVPQTVMRFPSASVRASTIHTPIAGMTTYLVDEQRVDVFDGDRWSAIPSGTPVWETFPLDETNWSHDTDNQGAFMYRVVSFFGEPTIMLRGGITRKTSYPGSFPAYFRLNDGSLPQLARPVSKRPMLAACSATGSGGLVLKIELGTDGNIDVYGIGGDTVPPWISFNGVFCSL